MQQSDEMCVCRYYLTATNEIVPSVTVVQHRNPINTPRCSCVGFKFFTLSKTEPRVNMATPFYFYGRRISPTDLIKCREPIANDIGQMMVDVVEWLYIPDNRDVVLDIPHTVVLLEDNNGIMSYKVDGQAKLLLRGATDD